MPKDKQTQKPDTASSIGRQGICAVHIAGLHALLARPLCNPGLYATWDNRHYPKLYRIIKVKPERMFDFGPKPAIPLAHSPTPLTEANMQAAPNKIIHGDCLEAMPLLPDKSTDIILCDLP